MNIHIICPEADHLAKDLAAVGPKVHARVVKSVAHHAAMLQTTIQAHASGRPGPNAPTGDYRRSWTFEVHSPPSGAVAVVGTNAPQGRRLELGFVGADSLGRVYNQPAYPHVSPAVAIVEPKFTADLAAIVDKETK